MFRIFSPPTLSKFYSRPKSKSSAVEPPSFSDVELRSRTASSTPLNPKRQSLGALRSDRRLRLTLGYLYPISPANLFISSFSHLLPPRVSPPSPPRRRLRRFTAGPPPPWRFPAVEKHSSPLLFAVARCVTKLGYAPPWIQSHVHLQPLFLILLGWIH